MKTKFTLMSVIALTVTACASTPPEEVAEIKAPEQQAPAPVFEDTAPTQIITEQPAVQPLGPVVVAGPTPGSLEDFVYAAGDDRVYFAYNRSDLSPQSRDVLKRQAEWLNLYPGSIVVVGGNADERGTREYNLALGARRADSAKAFLVSQGVTPSRITTVSYGKERPIDGRSNEAAWRLNRNAHSAVLTGGTS